MTSLQHDDGIEIIAFHGGDSNNPHQNHNGNSPQKASTSSSTGYYDIGSPTDSTVSHPSCSRQSGYYHLSNATSPTASESKNTYFSVENGDHVCVLPPGDKDPPTDKQKRVARVVMVLAGCLLLMSILLVGVTLTMSDHIDDMDSNKPENPGSEISQNDGLDEVRKVNGLSTSPATPQGSRSASISQHTNSTTR